MDEIAGLPKTGAKRDLIDLRDHMFVPRFELLPPEHLPWGDLFAPDSPGILPFGLRDQGRRDNCVGQALANLIDVQLRLRGAPQPQSQRVSAAMLYQMAMFYDVAEGTEQDGIRSLRSGIKAFFHHGVCPDGNGDDGWADSDAGAERRWPSEAQARAAQEISLGAYSRLRPILHHYHCAIREAGTVLVSARVHDGWIAPEDGRIALQEPRDNYHAVVILGYNREGFIILNSWGEDWGGYPLDGSDGPRARGMALWSYADWAKCVEDGWVLRLGVPGHDAFSVSAGPQGMAGDPESPGSTPYRMLQGHFINLDAGALREVGSYPTPAVAVASTEEGIIGRLKGDNKGVVLSLPGVMETDAQAFDRAVRQKFRLEAEGYDFLTCFWSANFATDMHGVLQNIFDRCRKQAGSAIDTLDQLFETAARGSGRAFWRDIERHAICAALPCDAEARQWSDRQLCDIRPRGTLGAIVERVADACAEAGKPLHIVANGAGALVVDGLLERFETRSTSSNPLDWIPALGNLVLAFPAVPLRQAEVRILRLADAMVAASPEGVPRATIIVPTPDLERRLTVHGYGRSILHLVSRSFLEQADEPMLGSYRAADPYSKGSALEVDLDGVDPTTIKPPFQTFGAAPAIRLEQHELDANRDLEMQILTAITRTSLPTHRPPPAARPKPPTEDNAVNAQDIPKITLSELQQRIAEGTLDPDAARYYFRLSEEASTPFAPVLLPNPEYVIMPGTDARSALALNSANTLARWARLSAYYARISTGYDGPRLAAEGDSWFQYPVRLFDVIDYVAERYAVFDSSAAGDLLENMARKREYIDALRQSGAEILLLSAGGNDVCAGGALADHLEEFDPALQPADYLKRGYQDLLDSAIGYYERICRDVNGQFPGVTIITHGYDYVIPQGGRWLGRPMESRGITDRGLQKRIAAEMIDQFNRALRRMAATMSHVAYVDCRNAVAANQWFDELHPTNAGFAPVASRILTRIKQITESRRERELMVDRVVPGGQILLSPQLVPQSLAGRRNLARSLHLGLNEIDPGHYAGDSGFLRGCENDARALRDLADAQGYATTTLLSREATREAVIEELRRAARDLNAGDQFLFTNASHGSQLADFNGDEKEIANRNPDSTICLFDGQMIDDELWHLLGDFKSGVRIVMISDSCHSGTIARVQRLAFDPSALPSIEALDQSGAMMPAARAIASLLPRRLSDATARAVEDLHRDFYADLSRQYRHVDRSVLTSPVRPVLAASLLQFGACRDDQVAMDGEEHGVFTAALLNVWNRGGFTGSYRQLHDRIVDALANLEQKPVLFTPAPVDPAFLRQRPFTLVGAELNRETEGMMRPAEPMAAEADLYPSESEPMAGEGALDATEPSEELAPEGETTARGLADGVPAATIARFRQFLGPLGLRHFDPAEFLTLGGSHFGGGAAHGLNAPPPETLWPNLVPTARLLDALRERLGVPVTISSAYRTAAYNRAVGGAANSWHRQFIACDIKANGASPAKVANALAEMRGQGFFRGGIGRYSSFTHVDTRGVNADWTGGGRDLQGQTDSAVDTASRKLSELAATIPVDATRPTGRSRSAGSADLAEADAAVNGAQILALDHNLPPELRKAVLYSTQFAQRAADAAADPVEDHEGWWSTLTSALSATGWSVQQSAYRRASSSDQNATLDALALEAIAALTSVTGKLNAIRSVLDSLRNATAGDKRLKLLDLHLSEKQSGAFQIGDAELGANDEVALSIGAVQFRSLDARKGVLFAHWGKSVDSVGVAAVRLIFNRDFYETVARPVVEQRLTDAQSQILAFKLERQPT